MEFLRLLSRRKSAGKQDRNSAVSNSSETVQCDQSSTSNPKEKYEVNFAAGRGLQKVPKGWRKSFHKIRRKSKLSSSSCDDIIENHAKSALHAEENKSSTRLHQKQFSRWSYSPDHTAEPALNLQPFDRPFVQRRNTDGFIRPQSNRVSYNALEEGLPNDPLENLPDSTVLQSDHGPCSTLAAASSADECITDTILRKSQSDQTLPVDSATNHLRSDRLTISHPQIKTIATDEKSYASQAQFSAADVTTAPHATLFEHEANSALDELRIHGMEQASEDNISWGSNEFDSDSDGFGNDVSLDINSKRNSDVCNGEVKGFSFKKHKEIKKDLSKGVRNFFDRKNPHKSNSKDEDASSFVELHISAERHPGPKLQPPSILLKPYQLRRRKIVETIIQSECSYIDSLERLEISYKKSLLDYKPLIVSLDVIEKIFCKVADILQCHQLFQIALAAAVNDWDDHEKIGDTFVASFSKSMVLECYSKYINNFTLAMELVRKTCKQKPQFLTFLRDRQNESQDRLNLYGLMLKPVQRFPQFIMLVQDLLKNTPKEHDDRLPLQLALTELETLAENLNRRRADSEEKSEMLRLLEMSNIKLISNETKDGRVRRLLKKDFVRERSYTVDGTIEKDRECLLVLTNDMLICCNCTSRRQEPRSGISAFKDIYKLKWCATLDILRVQDDRSSAINEYLKVKDDYSVLQTIAQQVEYLHFSYGGISLQQIQESITSLKGRMLQAENVTQYESDTSFTVNFPQKSGDFKRTLIISDAMQCNEWLESIYNSQVANEPKNLLCWNSVDSSDSEYLWSSPLFIDSVPCSSSNKSQQVQCAYAFMPASHITLLWLACSASTVLAVVNVYQIIHERIEKVHVMQVESSVQCMEHWNPWNDLPSVWLGMECGSLIEYSADSPYGKLYEVTMPTMSTVMIMRGFESNLYVGLLDGSLLLYTRHEGFKGLVHINSINVGNGPLTCLSALDGKLWGASGSDVITINPEKFTIESISAIPTETPLTVSHMVQVGSGFWVAFCEACDLHLYHLDSLRLLQDVNLSRPIRDFFQGLGWQSRVGEPCFVSSMSSSYWQLFVGMSNGLIMAMPLPKLPDSVPRITGPCRICYHMLNGPVNFLCAPELPSVSQPCEDEIAAQLPLNGPPEIPERSPIKPVRENSEARILAHKRTSSETLVCASDNESDGTFMGRKMKENRLSSIEPFNRNNSNFSAEGLKPLIPPARPPKPSPQKGLYAQVSCEELFENDFVFSPGSMDTSPSPSRTIQWKERRHRDLPVLLACGEGYHYPSEKKGAGQSNPSQKATTVLCWKVIV